MNLPEGRQIGVMASQMDTLFPSLVKQTIQPKPLEEELEGIDGTNLEDKEFQAVNYTGLIPHLINSIQEQQKMIDEQKQRIAELERKIE